MSKTMTLYFNILLSDEFEEAVRKYYNKDEVYPEDIREYLERNTEPAYSLADSFDIEGGDTDGWFIQGGDIEY